MAGQTKSADDDLDVYEDDEEDNIEEMYLTFSLLGGEYGVCLTNVIEIVVGQRIIEVPDVPAYIKGVINLRGKIIPIMDVRTRFGLPFRDYDQRLSIVVVEVNGVSTGIAVDEVKEVLQIPAPDVSLPPTYRAGASANMIKGMGKRKDGVCIILDVHRLLDGESSAVMREAAAAACPSEPS